MRQRLSAAEAFATQRLMEYFPNENLSKCWWRSHILVCSTFSANEGDLRKGPWLEEEDDQLAAAVAVLGDKRWDALAKASGLRRSGKSCRLRWMNYLRPNLKHGNISLEEEQIIIELHQKWGNRWSKIARRLPGRTDNEIKNYWRSYSKKKSPVVVEKECGSETSLRSECVRTTSPIKKDIFDASYEASLTEWMSKWPPDDFFDCKIYSPEWISGDWNISLWDGE